MLALRRLVGESIVIGDNIVITQLKNGRIGIDAPKHINIRRAELLEQPRTLELTSTDATQLSTPDCEDGSSAA